MGKMEERELIQSGYRYALSLARSSHDAEDLVQWAVIRLYQSKGRLHSLPLLFTTIRNLFYDQKRREKSSRFSHWRTDMKMYR